MSLSIITKNIIVLKSLPGYGNAKITKIIVKNPALIDEVLNYENIFQQIPNLQLSRSEFLKIEESLNQTILFVQKQNLKVLNLLDQEYPLCLRSIFNAPLLLYIKGTLDSYAYPESLAVVGARKSTSYGKAICENFIPVMVQNSFSIVSGLASGIDSVAHQVTLKNKGNCVAVIGHGHNFMYPASNWRLYNEIVEQGGCIISEFEPHIEPHPAFFPLRNRIIAGLARGTLVVEAAEKSGSLITAQYAFEENRDVFAVPGDFSRPMSSGCNHLIRKHNAKLVVTPEHILQEFNISEEGSKKITFENNPIQKKMLDILVLERLTTEQLSLRLGTAISKLSAELSELEINGQITRDTRDTWMVV